MVPSCSDWRLSGSRTRTPSQLSSGRHSASTSPLTSLNFSYLVLLGKVQSQVVCVIHPRHSTPLSVGKGVPKLSRKAWL